MKRRVAFVSRIERVLAMLFLLLAFALLFFLFFSPKAQATLHEESANERGALSIVDTIFKAKNYVGPPEHLRHARVKKFRKLQVLDLNAVDSLTLLRVPGIGRSFAHRILSLRQLLGGYYTVLQLQEVYGMDEDKFLALKPWFKVKTPPKSYKLKSLKAGEIPRHPYLHWLHVRELNRMINHSNGLISWKDLMKNKAFSQDDSIRLSPYFRD